MPQVKKTSISSMLKTKRYFWGPVEVQTKRKEVCYKRAVLLKFLQSLT